MLDPENRDNLNTPSELKLERFVLGELPERDRHEIEKALEADPALREKIRRLQESREALMREVPPDVFVKKLQARLRREEVEAPFRKPGASTGAAFVWKPLLGSLALLVVLAVPLGLFGPLSHRSAHVVDEARPDAAPAVPAIPTANHEAPQASEATATPTEGEGAVSTGTAPGSAPEPALVARDDIRLKGLEPHLALYRKTDSGAEPVRPGGKVRPGERLRIGYQPAGYVYGVVLSVDGNGNVTRHWPDSGEKAGRLEAGETLLPNAFELDAAPEYERFFLVVSKRPFEIDPLRQTLHREKSLPDLVKTGATSDVRIVRFEVLKENGI